MSTGPQEYTFLAAQPPESPQKERAASERAARGEEPIQTAEHPYMPQGHRDEAEKVFALEKLSLMREPIRDTIARTDCFSTKPKWRQM